MTDAYRPRRTCLSVPGSSKKMIDKADINQPGKAALDPDAIAKAKEESVTVTEIGRAHV